MSTDLEKCRLKLGFLPLTDCAPLVVAHELGLFEEFGLEVELVREASWASLRDKVAFGLLDGAQMLSSLPIATTLGLGGIQKTMLTGCCLSLNGNAITVSNTLFQRLLAVDGSTSQSDAVDHGWRLRQLIERDRQAGRPPLRFAHVFPTSNHHYQLRHWLTAAGIDPDRDLSLLVIPPARMVEHLRDGSIDGCCVGEPWGSLAVCEGVGQLLTSGHAIWNNSPEKVFGVTAQWHQQHPASHHALLKALLLACDWLDRPRHRNEAAQLLARPEYVDAPAEVLEMALTGNFRTGQQKSALNCGDFIVFSRYAANFPWLSHAEWLLTQMYRWGQLDQALDLRELAGQVYRPDLFRAAATELGLPVPTIDRKSEGSHAGHWMLSEASTPLLMGPDQLIDGSRFDPAQPIAQLLTQPPPAQLRVDLAALAALNHIPH